MNSESEDLDIEIDFDEEADEEIGAEDHTEIVNVSALDLGLSVEEEALPKIIDEVSYAELSVESDQTQDLVDHAEENELFGDYSLLGRVGGNEYVEVWLAGDRANGRTCVLKRVPRPSESRSEVANISEEIRVTEGLAHPNIVETLAGGIIDGIPFISMELVDGMSLTELNGVMGRSQRAGRHLCMRNSFYQ